MLSQFVPVSEGTLVTAGVPRWYKTAQWSGIANDGTTQSVAQVLAVACLAAPSCVGFHLISGGQSAQELPSGWTMDFDTASQATYFVNDLTGETKWGSPRLGTGALLYDSDGYNGEWPPETPDAIAAAGGSWEWGEAGWSGRGAPAAHGSVAAGKGWYSWEAFRRSPSPSPSPSRTSLSPPPPSPSHYFLADGGESCSTACANKDSPVTLACDLRAITAAAASVATCTDVLSALGMSYTHSGMHSDDDSGCTYHPGQTGWAQVMNSGRDSGATPAPTCDEVNADSSRRRVCACDERRPMQGGCCQRSLTDDRVAPWEYLNGVPIALESRTIGCTRNRWMPDKTYSKATGKCEDLRRVEIVPAKEITLVLKAGGTVEEYEAKADSVKASLRQELQCFSPACVLTVTVEAGSVILTVVATITSGGASQVESAAVALQAKRLDVMSSMLGITIEEAPSAPSAIDVQVQVARLAPSPPPPSGADQRAATEKKRLVVGLAGGAASIVAAFALLYVLMRRVWGLPRPPRISQSHMPVEGRPLPLPPPKLPLAVEAVALGEGEAPPAYGVAVARGMAV